MHLAVEHNAYQILAYLLIELKLNPNQLCGKTQEDDHIKSSGRNNSEQGILHMAIQEDRQDVIDLIMSSPNVDLNLMSPIVGTPLHVASRKQNLKVV